MIRLDEIKYSNKSTYYSILVGDLLQASGTPRNPIDSLSRLRASIILLLFLFFLSYIYKYLSLSEQNVILLPFHLCASRFVTSIFTKICITYYSKYMHSIVFIINYKNSFTIR